MQILCNLDWKISNSAVSLGKFDGIHLGHRLLLDEILRRGDSTPTVFTFALDADGKRGYIYSEREKEIILKDLGIKRVVLFPFDDETKKMEPEDFIEKILVEKMGAEFICVGEDFRFGRNRRGNVGTLKAFASRCGYEVKVHRKLKSGDDVVSSTLIRKKLENGDIKQANEFLGRPYFIEGEVIHGNALGRRLDMPTANIVPDEGKTLPPSGVYATTVMCGAERFPAVTNIGRKPTVGVNRIGVETSIINFDKDIYGKRIIVQFHEFIRDEKKFPDIGHLKNQMEIDKKKAMEILRAYRIA